MITPHENESRDLLLAQQFRDAYQKGWSAGETGRFFAKDLRPLVRKGRLISIDRVLKASKALDVRSVSEFGSWRSWLQDALRTLVFSLWRPSARVPRTRAIRSA